MIVTEDTLFKLIHIALTGKNDFKILEHVNWESLINIAEIQGVAAIVCDGLQKVIDSGEMFALKDENKPSQILLLNVIGLSMTIEKTCKNQYSSAKKLSCLWKQHDIRTIVLKGMAFGSYYPNPLHRPCADMDCYLCGKYDEGNTVIEHLGIDVCKEDYRHSTFYFDDLHVENHKICSTVRGRKQRKIFEKYLRGLLEYEPTSYLPGSNIEVPCPLFNALYFLQHAHRHFMRESITLRHICDWAMIVDKCNDKIDWVVFKEVAKKNEVMSFAESMSRLAYIVCGVKCEALVESHDLKPQDRMLLDDCYAIADNAIKYGNKFKAHCQMVKNMINQRWKYKYYSDRSFGVEIISSIYGVFFEKDPIIES